MRGQSLGLGGIRQESSNRDLIERELSEVYYPVKYSVSDHPTIVPFGYDHYSDPVRRKAMENAIKYDQPFATSPLHLFRFASLTPQNSDFLIFVPVFSHPEPRGAEREIRGFLVGVFRIPIIVREAFGHLPPLGLNLDISDRSTKSSTPAYSYVSRLAPSGVLRDNETAAAASRFVSMRKIEVAGQSWELRFSATEAYLASVRSWHPALILLCGLLITSFVSSYILVLQAKNTTVVELVSELKNEAEQQLAIISAQHEISTADKNLDTVTNIIMARIAEATLAEGSAMEFVEGDEIVFKSAYGSIAAFAGMRIKRGISLSGICVATGKVVRCDDTENDERVDLQACRKLSIRSMLLVPLRVDDRVIGVLKVVSSRPNTFTDRDGVRLHVMAGVMASALRDAASAAELSEKNVQLSRATEFKSQFLANMSHEIRTPLTSIIGYSETLLHDKLDKDEQDTACKTILRNGKHLLQIINDILDFSKIEAGKLDTECVAVSLFELMSDIGNLMRYKAEEQGISFGFDFVFPVPSTIQTDPTRLKQILINLVGNGIKFTREGSVKILVSCNRESEEIRFDIVDTGIGMSEEQQKKLFKAFSQADTSTTRQFGGTGLGLVISHQLAEKLGGGVTVSSKPGEGSTFSVVVSTGPLSENLLTSSKPASRKEAVPVSHAEHVHYGGRVLVAEDGPDNQQYISFVLRKAKVDFVMVENGELAVRAAETDSFDLILMDMQMPIMDGYTAVKTLRDRGCPVPIVALTANIMKQDIERCLTIGCTDYLGKPFERKAFYEKIGQYLENVVAPEDDELKPVVDDDDHIPLILGFVNSLPHRYQEFSAAFQSRDWGALEVLAHRLHGAAHMFGYPSLGEAAADLEEAVISASYQEAPAYMQRLERVCQRISKGKHSLEVPENSHDRGN